VYFGFFHLIVFRRLLEKKSLFRKADLAYFLEPRRERFFQKNRNVQKASFLEQKKLRKLQNKKNKKTCF
jgi:hypothetical protein